MCNYFRRFLSKKSTIFLIKQSELNCKMAHQLGFPFDFDPVFDFFPTVVDVFEGSGDDIHMIVGVCASADAEAKEVVAVKAVFPRDGVAVSE